MLDCRALDGEIKAHSLWAACQVKTFWAGVESVGLIATPSTSATGEKTLTWAAAPMPGPLSELNLTAKLNAIAAAYDARPAAEKISLSGRIARMTDPAWWTRNLRRETVRRNEAEEHAAGGIRRKTQCYATDHAVKIKGIRAKANRATLEGLEVVNETGAAFNLQEVADKSVSNPKIRRGELMLRARGFEETAKLMGHVAIFLTITCPSRFHRWAGSGLENKAWDGATPRDAQDYLCSVWAKIRAAWGRRGFAPYGFRVAEPHHDACPHWHILLFMPAEQETAAVKIAHAYAMADTPTERGAMKHRFTVEKIDTSKGSATGYIAKYISKNIDGETQAGENVGLDFASGKKATDASARVKTWATTWGIRQFQQVGGPSVTVWRELRRLGAVDESVSGSQLDLFHGPQNAADQGLWSLFWFLQGGPDVKRQDLTLSPAYTSDTIGKYGDEVTRITGVNALGFDGTYTTRLHTWTVQRAGLADVNACQAEHRADMAAAAAVQRFLTSVTGNSNGANAVRTAWTGVNNCTGAPFDTTANPFDFSGFDVEQSEILYLQKYSRRGEPDEVAAEVETARADEAAAQKMNFQGYNHAHTTTERTRKLLASVRAAHQRDANAYRRIRG